jgi:hypothetical protein
MTKSGSFNAGSSESNWLPWSVRSRLHAYASLNSHGLPVEASKDEAQGRRTAAEVAQGQVLESGQPRDAADVGDHGYWRGREQIRRGRERGGLGQDPKVSYVALHRRTARAKSSLADVARGRAHFRTCGRYGCAGNGNKSHQMVSDGGHTLNLFER